MARLSAMLGSTVGKKYTVAITGVLLIGFLIFHLLGNLNLFQGPEALNQYARDLEALPGSMLGELGLAGLFLLHIGLTLSLARENAKARPVAYSQLKAPTHFASAWMVISGGTVLLFLVVHVLGIRLGERGEHMNNLYNLVMENLTHPVKAVIYIAGVSVLFFHLAHGIQAVCRTLGVSSPEHLARIGSAAKGLALILALGFLSMPVWAWFQ